MSQPLNKITVERNQRALLDLASKPGNGEPRRNMSSPCGLRQPVIDVCADCKARNPRWASHNLGIFIWYVFPIGRVRTSAYERRSMNCASIHRKIGTHVTKVYVDVFRTSPWCHCNVLFRKSLTLDSWTKEQVEVGIHIHDNAFTLIDCAFSALRQEYETEREHQIKRPV